MFKFESGRKYENKYNIDDIRFVYISTGAVEEGEGVEGTGGGVRLRATTGRRYPMGRIRGELGSEAVSGGSACDRMNCNHIR